MVQQFCLKFSMEIYFYLLFYLTVFQFFYSKQFNQSIQNALVLIYEIY